MSKRRPITESLRIGDVVDDELTTVLTSVLPRGAQLRSNEVEYRTDHDECAIIIRYSGGQIVEALAGPALTDAILEQAGAAIEHALLGEKRSAVCRWFAFCSGRQVEGTWIYRDEWQIAPAPEEAPRPQELMADHPFILDFTFADSPDFRIRQQRYVSRAADYLMVLNLLLVPRIVSMGARSRKHWMLVQDEAHQLVRPIWAQEGYFVPGFRFIVTGLPVQAASEMDELAPNEYYGLAGSIRDTLAVPKGLGELIDRFLGLPTRDRENFLRACYWYNMAQTMWDHSQSLYFTSLVNSVECLASVGRERGNPEGPTALFLEFMSNFAPGGPSKTELNKLYQVRSEISHGGRLLHLDSSTRAWALSQQSARDREIGDNASILVKGALVNWLWLRGDDSTGHFVTEGVRGTKPAKPGTKSLTRIVSA